MLSYFFSSFNKGHIFHFFFISQSVQFIFKSVTHYNNIDFCIKLACLHSGCFQVFQCIHEFFFLSFVTSSLVLVAQFFLSSVYYGHWKSQPWHQFNMYSSMHINLRKNINFITYYKWFLFSFIIHIAVIVGFSPQQNMIFRNLQLLYQ